MDTLRTSGGMKLSLIAGLSCCMCIGGCDNGSGEWSDSATKAIDMVTNLLQCAAACHGTPLYTDGKWRQASRQCKEQLDGQLFAVRDMQERMKLADWIERHVYAAMEGQTNDVATMEFCCAAANTIDSLAHVLWTSTGDANLIFGLWERFRRRGLVVADRCETERGKIEPEYRRLKRNTQYLSYRFALVKQSELTPQEREMAKEVREKRWPVEERYRYLDELCKAYRGVLVWDKGRRLDDGELYARFTQLSQKELDELVRK